MANYSLNTLKTKIPVPRTSVADPGPDPGTSLSIIAGKNYAKQNIFSSGPDPDPAFFFSGSVAFKMPTKKVFFLQVSLLISVRY